MSTLPSLSRAKWFRHRHLQHILHILNEDGAETRIAGGAVRNALLKRPIADIDLATTLMPEAVMQRGKDAGFGVHPTGLAHGTVTLVVDGTPFEVTTLRYDVKTDGRHAEVAFTHDWAADAQRRDFTINALYCDAKGKIYDYTAGYRDIQTQKVRFVGSPARRIAEDHLRILRFFRFHAHYGIGSPDADSLAACIRHRRKLKTLSTERVRDELLKLLGTQGALPIIKLMAETKVLSEILPHTEEFGAIARLPADPLLRLFILAKKPKELQSTLRLSNQQAQRLAAMAAAPNLTLDLRPAEQRRLLYALQPQNWSDAVNLSRAKSRRHSDPKWQRLLSLPNRWSWPKFPVTGHDLQQLGLAPGPRLGKALRDLEDWWISADFKPTREHLLARIGK